jgi:hypothetical protein
MLLAGEVMTDVQSRLRSIAEHIRRIEQLLESGERVPTSYRSPSAFSTSDT